MASGLKRLWLFCFNSEKQNPESAPNPNEGEIVSIKSKSILNVPQLKLKMVNESEDVEYLIDQTGLRGS
jgi:hypothetical protein